MNKPHVVLVGLPGAGKSTVGRLLSDRFGVPLYDIDILIEDRQGLPITEIFASLGESAFRALERRAVEEFLGSAARAVVTPGGGWAAMGDNVARAGAAALTVYLVTDPAEAAQRVAGTQHRPLIAGHDPTVRMRELLAEREVAYLQCEARVNTDRRAPAEVVEELAELARTRAGW